MFQYESLLIDLSIDLSITIDFYQFQLNIY